MPIIRKNSLRIFRFLLTGGFGAGLYIVGSFILTTNGMEAWIASFIVYACLVPVVYFIQKQFVFESGKSDSKSFPRYLVIQVIGLGLSAILPFLLAKINVSPIISFFFLALVISITNYVLQLRWAFSIDNKNGELN